MKKHLKRFIAECIVCQQNHYEATLPPALLQPNPIPNGVWQDISMDFVEGLPKSEGKSVILVVVDRFTKYAHFVPLSHPYTAKVVAEIFIQHVFKLHGLPKSIITDRDPVFLSSFFGMFSSQLKVPNCAKLLLITLKRTGKLKISTHLSNI